MIGQNRAESGLIDEAERKTRVVKRLGSKAWWGTSVLSALGRPRQED